MTRIMLVLAGFLALLPIVHTHVPGHHQEASCAHEAGHGAEQGSGETENEHAEQFCVLATLQKSTTIHAPVPTVTTPERLNEPVVAVPAADPLVSQLPRSLSPRAPPAA